MIWVLKDASINYPTDNWTTFIVWITSSVIIGLIFLFLHFWWIKRPSNQKYLKIRKEEGVLTYIKRNIFLMFSFIFLISLITAITTLIAWLH